MDLPAAFYLQTVERIFQQHELARGVLVSRDRKVEPAAIRRTALLTVEGENDDICAIGQTLAAQELCWKSILPIRRQPPFADRRRRTLARRCRPGRRWATENLPARPPDDPVEQLTSKRRHPGAEAWFSVVRPSRCPPRGLLRMRVFLHALENMPHPEEARSAVSKDAGCSCSGAVSPCANSFARSTPGWG